MQIFMGTLASLIFPRVTDFFPTNSVVHCWCRRRQ